MAEEVSFFIGIFIAHVNAATDILLLQNVPLAKVEINLFCHTLYWNVIILICVQPC